MKSTITTTGFSVMPLGRHARNAASPAGRGWVCSSGGGSDCRVRLCAVAALALLWVGQAQAVNKCTDPKTGQVTYSDAPCANTQSNTKMEWAPKADTNVVAQPGRSSSGRSTNPNGGASAPPEADGLMGAYRRWIDAEKLAGSTARIALAGPVAALQELKRNTESMKVQACVATAQKSLVALMDACVNGYLNFMQQQELYSLVWQRVDRDKLIREFESEVGSARCKVL